MAITVTEKPDSRPSSDGQDASAELLYTVRGAADDAAAKAALASEAPTTWPPLHPPPATTAEKHWP